MSNNGQLDPFTWLLGVLGTITLGWVGSTSLKTERHAVKIATLETHMEYTREALDRIEEHLGTKPKEK